MELVGRREFDNSHDWSEFFRTHPEECSKDALYAFFATNIMSNTGNPNTGERVNSQLLKHEQREIFDAVINHFNAGKSNPNIAPFYMIVQGSAGMTRFSRFTFFWACSLFLVL
jgi:hypothetical protein